jgi:hypothetical protein
VLDKLRSSKTSDGVNINFSKCLDPFSKYIKEKTSGPDYENMSNGLSMTTLTSNFSNITMLKNHKREIDDRNVITEREDEVGSGANHNSKDNHNSRERTFSNT